MFAHVFLSFYYIASHLISSLLSHQTIVSRFMHSTMSSSSKVAQDYSPMLKIYEDGHIERLLGTATVPPSLDHPLTLSKDVRYSPQLNLSSRLYLPKKSVTNNKLPLLVYYHGGGFCVETAFSPTYHNYLNSLVAEANVVAVSVDYRLAPEHPLPAGYEDSWTALQWVASHCNGDGQEEWINVHVDFNKVYLAGDSSGGNVAHFIARRFGEERINGINIAGLVLIHPFFRGEEPIGDEVKYLEVKKGIDSCWLLACPNTSGLDDPLINPSFDPDLRKLGCGRVVVLIAEKDWLKDRDWKYCETLKKSGWEGCLEVLEAKEEQHVFHHHKPNCDNALAMLKKIVAFLNQ